MEVGIHSWPEEVNIISCKLALSTKTESDRYL